MQTKLAKMSSSQCVLSGMMSVNESERQGKVGKEEYMGHAACGMLHVAILTH